MLDFIKTGRLRTLVEEYSKDFGEYMVPTITGHTIIT